MNHVRPRASQLATWYKSLQGAQFRTQPTKFCTSATCSRYLSQISPSRRSEVQTKIRSTPVRAIQNIRHCSNQRAMCRANAEGESGSMVTQAREVLPTNVKPTHYDLTLEPNFENFTFEGKVITE